MLGTKTETVIEAHNAPVHNPRSPAFIRLISTPSGAIGLAILLILLIASAFPDLISPYAPTKIGAGRKLLAPGFRYLAGTDEFGRDMFSRLVHGARLTLEIGIIAVSISLVSGTLLGLAAAYARGFLEVILMRLSDVLFSFTETLIALACVAVLGPSLENAMIAVGLAGIPYYARTSYAAALVETSKPYFEASIAAGAGHLRLIFVHLLPNILPIMIVVATLGLSSAILAAAGLSFLGLGAQPPAPEWGAMLSSGRDFFNKAPWLMIYPGLAIAIVVLAFNLLGDAIREVVDPMEAER
ncbi:peptide/nickel transport system permease protein [Pararhizobium capsulatum DSM 1112]|uniref:Peptide/nickel transport system permease protein n=1 Tax=Pararhizobium capsulatum DSM 1112 TaxID=1121113 RepID=A0ABU0BYB1_9HYPH|nr:ABC transporter permease [Pararhizobium capsulatum]MDQ0323253.1 peptide/nickel transport system permease protein [Pararhizobium capsulatum DSM 1112]